MNIGECTCFRCIYMHSDSPELDFLMACCQNYQSWLQEDAEAQILKRGENPIRPPIPQSPWQLSAASTWKQLLLAAAPRRSRRETHSPLLSRQSGLLHFIHIVAAVRHKQKKVHHNNLLCTSVLTCPPARRNGAHKKQQKNSCLFLPELINSLETNEKQKHDHDRVWLYNSTFLKWKKKKLL